MSDESRQPPRSTTEKLKALTVAVAIIQLVCGLGFAVDLYVEFPDPRAWRYLSPQGVAHLSTELTIMVMLFVGFALARRAHVLLARQRDGVERNLAALKEDFDHILHARFDAWSLTPAQRDVALLCLRGLRISEIAAMRGSAEGTVKSHLSAIFRAAGVGTRSELVALFMEEFMDHGAASAS